MTPTRSTDASSLRPIAGRFLPEPAILTIEPTGSGHIHDSFRVTTLPGNGSDGLLQRINRSIFGNPQALMTNILRVTTHIREKILQPNSFPLFSRMPLMNSLTIFPARDGNLFFTDDKGSCWRMYAFLPGSHSHDRLTSPALAKESGKAFGWFLMATADLDPGVLHQTLPRFHDIRFRLEQFDNACKRDPFSRSKESTSEINLVNQLRETMKTFGSLPFPVRVTHNDTKCNNLLFDDQNRAICVVDLDTVMPGSLLHDFGDAIRTGAATSAEDETNKNLISIDISLFDSYAEGFLQATSSILQPTEWEHLAFSVPFMTYLIGLRFLTDYLNGDIYYKTNHPTQNLERARNQFFLLQDQREKIPLMKKTIDKFRQDFLS